MINPLKNKEIMVWTFMGNARMYEALSKYGDRISQIGLFSFKVRATGEIYESGVSISNMMPYIQQWPHIRWLLTVANDGYNPIFKAIRENTNGAQDMFLSELIRIMQKYPWCDGVDIDLEGGGDYSTAAKSTAMFQNIHHAVKSYDARKRINICLPGMTSVNGSVGGENWCVYADLAPYCDTASIMSYGMAWAGSAPGPVSPRDWLEGIYDYAVSVMPPSKIYFGMPAYGWNWQIYDTPENLGKYYRGVSHTYYGAKNWMTGYYQFKETAPASPQIPIIAYWDDYDKGPFALPHVYDYMEGQDAEHYSYPLMGEVYKRRRYLTSYGKTQKTNFGGVVVDRNAQPDSYSGIVSISEYMVTLGDNGEVVYEFDISEAGTYDLVVKLGFPLWDKNSVYLSLDGTSILIEENRLWWPYWRSTFWKCAWKEVSLSAGTHTLAVSVAAKGVQFYGFKVCQSFSEETSVSEASYTLSPKKFKDINGVMVGPREGFKLTFEMLRRKADSALIWYEDFRDRIILPESYWAVLSGEWEVWQKDDFEKNRPYSQLEGYGELALNYEGFQDLHLRAQLIFPESFTGRAGIFLGNLFCCLNYGTQAVELYQGDVLLGSYETSFQKTPGADIRVSPNIYTIEMRKRGTSVRVYSGASNRLRFQRTVTDTSGFAGIRADNKVHCQLFRVGDSYTYEPYERFDVVLPDESLASFGRIQRTGGLWDEEFQVFTVTSDIEEHETRTENISLDYEFFHSKLLPLVCGNDYQVTVIPKDINVWISRIFLGDSDGFSILYYQDVDSLIYWANEAAYHWKVRGMCMWSLGQEDLRLWDWLPKQV